MKENINKLNEIYVNYLKTPALDFKNELSKPIRSKLFDRMMSVNDNYSNYDLVKELISDSKKTKGRLLFWSDQHFFHKNIITFCNRPFADLMHMNDVLLRNYRAIVKPNDVVVWGGDISFGDKNKTINLLKNLPGKKILVLGNHDFDRKYEFINYQIFDAVILSFDYTAVIDNEDWNIVVTHYPINSDLLPEKTINVHGHIHTYEAGINNLNMSVEHTNYAPINIEEKLKLTVFNIKNNIYPKVENLESTNLKNRSGL